MWRMFLSDSKRGSAACHTGAQGSLSAGTRCWCKRSVQDWRSLDGPRPAGVKVDDKTFPETAVQPALTPALAVR
jgi:hypothetical protein